MISPNQRWLGGFVLAVALLPSLARAQTTSFDELRHSVKANTMLTVTDNGGREMKGRLREMTASSLVLLIGDDAQPLTLADSSVVKITRRSSRALGAFTGLGIGALAGLLIGPNGKDDCEYISEVFSVCALMGLAIGGGIGSAVGAVAIGWSQTLYQVPNQVPSQASRLTVTPMLSPKGAGIRVSRRF